MVYVEKQEGEEGAASEVGSTSSGDEKVILISWDDASLSEEITRHEKDLKNIDKRYSFVKEGGLKKVLNPLLGIKGELVTSSSSGEKSVELSWWNIPAATYYRIILSNGVENEVKVLAKNKIDVQGDKAQYSFKPVPDLVAGAAEVYEVSVYVRKEGGGPFVLLGEKIELSP